MIVLCFNTKGQGIKFLHGDINEALAEAKTENKPLFIDVYTSWCGPCKKLSKTIFTKKNVGSFFNKKFVSYKLQADKNKKFQKLANKFKVRAYPTLIWLDCNGNLLHISIGFKNEKALIAEAKKVFNENERVGTAISKWNKGDRSFSTVEKYFSYNGNYKGEFDKYFRNLKMKEKISDKIFEFIAKMNISVEGQTFDFLLKHRKEYKKIVPEWRLYQVVDSRVASHIERSYNTNKYKALIRKYKNYGIKKIDNYAKKAEWMYALKTSKVKDFFNLGEKYINSFNDKKSFAYYELITGIFYTINPKEYNRYRNIALQWTNEYINLLKDGYNSYTTFVMGYIISGDILKAKEIYYNFIKKIKSLSSKEKTYANHSKEYIERIFKDFKIKFK